MNARVGDNAQRARSAQQDGMGTARDAVQATRRLAQPTSVLFLGVRRCRKVPKSRANSAIVPRRQDIRPSDDTIANCRIEVLRRASVETATGARSAATLVRIVEIARRCVFARFMEAAAPKKFLTRPHCIRVDDAANWASWTKRSRRRRIAVAA